MDGHRRDRQRRIRRTQYFDLQPAARRRSTTVHADPPPSLAQLLAICDLVLQEDERVDDLTLQAFLHSRDYFRATSRFSLNDFISTH